MFGSWSPSFGGCFVFCVCCSMSLFGGTCLPLCHDFGRVLDTWIQAFDFLCGFSPKVCRFKPARKIRIGGFEGQGTFLYCEFLGDLRRERIQDFDVIEVLEVHLGA